MSSAAQAIPAASDAAPKISAWRDLQGLRPYLARYSGKVLAGFVVLVAGNVVGALLPLAIGTIIDSLSGSRALLERFTALPAPLYQLLLSFYQPFSRQTLLFYAAVLMGIVAVYLSG